MLGTFPVKYFDTAETTVAKVDLRIVLDHD